MGSSNPIVRRGKWTGDGNDRTVLLGFKPARVTITNVTDRIEAKKSDTMVGDKALNRDVGGVGTYVDLVTLNSDGFTVLAALNVDTKELHYVAEESKNEA